MFETQVVPTEVTDSVIAGTVRSFEMPTKRVEVSRSSALLVAVLLSIMLAAGALLVWCALAPQGNADAAPTTQVTTTDDQHRESEGASTSLTCARLPSGK